MEVLSGMTEGLRNFAAQYNYAINDPDLIRRYRMFEDGKRDVATKVSVAVKDTKIDLARRMKSKGYSVSDIVELTGVSASEVNAL